MTDRRATLVLGLGQTGRSVLRHLAGTVEMIGVDTRDDDAILAGVERDFPSVDCIPTDRFDTALERSDRVVVSPGIPIDDERVSRARARSLAITSDIEMFLDTVGVPVVGVTGTNGKSTVTSLTGHLLAGAGQVAATGGNLGPPALDLIAPEVDRYVVELSSFQLERLENPGLDVGICLNVTDDHLDRHASMENYAAIKRRIFDGSRVAIFNRVDPATQPVGRCSHSITLGGHDWRVDDDRIIADGHSIDRADLPLYGDHNAFNMLAALAAARASGVDVPTTAPLLRTFAGLPHRGSVVADVAGVRFVDDSKATNVGATAAALAGDDRVVLIAGGDGKGASFEPLVDPVRRNVSAAVLIGRDAERLAHTLDAATDVRFADSLDGAVTAAFALARQYQAGCVLLSPACASLDMFENFAERGEQFGRAARRIAGDQGGGPW